MNSPQKLLLIVLLAMGGVGVRLPAADFFVSPAGDDAGDGSRGRPFATLERARDAVRQLPRPLAEPVTVWLRGGNYFLGRSFELTEADSGTVEAPVSYRGYGREVPRLLGGQFLRGFEPVRDEAIRSRLDPAARDQVRQVDLRAQGITNFGVIRSRGYGRPTQPAHAELFVNREPATLARWPNTEWSRIAGFPRDGAKGDSHGGSIGEIKNGFLYEGDRPRRWRDLTNVWIHGFWAWQWANSYERIGTVDFERRLITNAFPGGHFGFRPGQRIHFFNALEELDAPGEWQLERKSGMLYLWPAGPEREPEALLSLLEAPLIRLREVRNVSFQGLVLEATRTTGIEVQGGSRVRIESCVIRNVGNHGVALTGGKDHTVAACNIHHTGDCGVIINAGDRQTLTPAGHAVENCHLHHNGRWTYTYVPAIRLQGVGSRASHNRIHDHPHIAIWFEGNEHLLEFNEIYHVATDTGDVGAVYSGRDWTYRGNRIRHNSFRDITGMDGSGQGIYLDDCMSSAEVYGNVFTGLKRAVHLAGGRDHRVLNNVFVDCDVSLDVDGRGLDGSPIWQSVQKVMRDDARKIPWELYAARYPELRTVEPFLKAEKPVPPEGNLIARNVSDGGKFITLRQYATATHARQEDNLVNQDPKFANRARGDFRLRKNSPALRLGFQQLPLREIGLEADDARRVADRLDAAQP